jgi:hypothetical protein
LERHQPDQWFACIRNDNFFAIKSFRNELGEFGFGFVHVREFHKSCLP